jgi:AGCS family alanine or glycine:cation symporter
MVLLGGIKSIGRTASVIVPIMIVFYMIASLFVVFRHIDRVPEVFILVISKAFTPMAAVGGFSGAMVAQAMRWGIARGVFSNESGLGSAPIAAAAAQTKDPVTQALVSMTQTFIDTIVVCSLTGFVILSSGTWTSGVTGAALTSNSFSTALPGTWGGWWSQSAWFSSPTAPSLAGVTMAKNRCNICLVRAASISIASFFVLRFSSEQ